LDPSEILNSESWNQAVKFHGHVCPGLSIGYKAAITGLEWLRSGRAEDEEIVAIVETNACGADAVQCLTGCTFGKGNLIFKDHGKQVYTFFSRSTGRGTRMALKPEVLELDDRHLQLIDLMREDAATDKEIEEFWLVHKNKSLRILEKDPVDLFEIREVTVSLPPKAKIERSELCDQCGEPTMASKLEGVGGKKLCADCSSFGSGCD
jgi:formylmethanofuran dehydrogenase subunit E